MIEIIFLEIAASLAVITVLCGIYRLALGPTVIDRIIGFETIVLGIITQTILLSLLYKTGVYVELILVIALLGFFGTVALVLFLEHEPDSNRTPLIPTSRSSNEDEQT